jgi:hypothetical protein
VGLENPEILVETGTTYCTFPGTVNRMRTRQIILTRGFVATVDDADYDALSDFEWYAQVMKSGKAYASRRTYSGNAATIFYMHRQIMGFPVHGVVDHIDRNPLNNTRANLRVVSKLANIINSDFTRNGGVWLCRETGRWVARISVNGKKLFLGRYDTREEALAAARAEREKYTGL